MAEIIDITRDMTLGEIQERHLDNFNLILQVCKKYYFNHEKKAFAFQGQCVNAGMKKFGIDQLEMAANVRMKNPKSEFDTVLERDINEKMLEKGLQVQRLENIAEVWKAGFYFFHGNEIAYWISEINAEQRKHSGKKLILPRLRLRFFIRTNVPM